MRNKIIKLIKKDSFLYIISNLIFSISTYLIMLVIPYYLNIKLLAEFTGVYQIILLYIVIFELGISIGYIRYNQIYKSIKIINSFLQMFILIVVFMLPYTIMGDLLNNLVGLNKTNIYINILYWSTLSLISWTLIKSILLSDKSYKTIFLFAISILIIRLICLIYFIEEDKYININNLFLGFFILPFIIIIIYLLYYHINIIYTFLKSHHKLKTLFTSYKNQIRKYISFSILSFISGLIYNLMLKILIIFLLTNNEDIKLSEIGYALTFIGIITIFVISIRNLYISKFKFNEKNTIIKYISFLDSIRVKVLISSVIISFISAIIVYFIKPNYLSQNTIFYTFIIILSYSYISYISMYTLLSKTFNKNILEIKINIIRLVGVFLIVYFLIEQNFLLLIILIYTFITSMEYIYYKILLKQIEIQDEIK